jgi:hypothetical protein
MNSEDELTIDLCRKNEIQNKIKTNKKGLTKLYTLIPKEK